VEQASRGAFLFRNKSDLRPHRPFLANLTWWTAGVFAIPFRRDPRLGFLMVGAIGLLGLLGAAARLLRLGGLSGGPLAWGLALFATGGGLGWLRYWLGRPWSEIPDLGTLLYPFAQIVVSPHAIVGTALLLGSLAFFLEWRAGGPRWPWLLCANLLGITRPYDLAVFGAMAAALLAHDLWRTRSLRGALELIGLLPALFYNALVFGLHPSFSLFMGAQNDVPLPAPVELLFAVGPAAALALVPARGREGGGDVARTAGLGALAVVALLFVVRLPFTLQFVNALGALLLVRAALVAPKRLLAPAVAVLSPTALCLLWILFHPSPQWFPPRDYTQTADLLRARCRDQDVLLAPVDPGLIVFGRTPCSLAIGHRVVTPDLLQRVEETRRFYSASTPPAWRADLLNRLGVRFVLMPRGKGDWLEGSGFVPVFALPSLEAWERAPAPPAGAATASPPG
jgi:hypothetical protein